MKIAEFSVRNPQFTLIAFLCLAMLGVTAFLNMPRTEDPYFPSPNFGIIAVYPGAEPTQLEREVVDVLEEELSELTELRRLQSFVNANVAYLDVEFESGIDPDDKENEVRRQVDAARNRLPEGVTTIDVEHWDSADVSVLQLALVVGDTPWEVVDTEAERIVRRLKSIAGVRDAKAWGIPEQQVRVDLELGRLGRIGVPPTQVIGALQGGNASIPGGEIELGGRRFNVQTTGAFESLAELESSVVGGGAGSVVQLRDVATVRFADAPETVRARFQGARVALISITSHGDTNVFPVRDAVLAAVAELSPTLAGGMKLELVFDQSRNVQRRLGGLQKDFLIAIVLVLVTLVPLGLRASLVVMVSIPMSLAIGMATLSWLGYSLNQLSIVGFVIALGLLVDDSIVVAENIARWMRTGATPVAAAIAATRQIGVAVLGCTATLVFAFLPLLFLPGNAGEFIRSLPVAVVVTILASLLVSFTLIPYLASRFLRNEHEHGNAAFRAMSRFIEGAYRPVLAVVMHRPRLTLLLATALVAASFLLVPRIGFSLFPKAGIPQFMIHVETPDGAGLDTTDEVTRELERILRAEPLVTHVSSVIGVGHPAVYYNVGARSESPSVADVFVRTSRYRSEEMFALLERLRARVAQLPGAEITVREFENGPPVLAPIDIRFTGPDLDQLRGVAEQATAWIKAIPGTRDLRNPLAVSRTDLGVELDETKAALAGISQLDVDRAVRMAVSGLEIGDLKTPSGRELPIVVGLPSRGAAWPRLANLDELELSGLAGSVPLAQIATLTMRQAPKLISHYDRERAVSVTADVEAGANAQQVSRAVLDMMAQRQLPPGVSWAAGGLHQSQEESFAGLGPAVIIAIFGVLAILVLEFRSFRATIIVAAVIPLGAMGGLLALFLAGETLSFTASIGFVALIGIEVKNSLLLVDFTNQLRAQGTPLDVAIARAGEIRFFPILLTSMTAIGGLLPLVIENSALYSPLALVIIGGLVSSTVLSRLVTPVLSLLLLPRDEPADAVAQPAV